MLPILGRGGHMTNCKYLGLIPIKGLLIKGRQILGSIFLGNFKSGFLTEKIPRKIYFTKFERKIVESISRCLVNSDTI